MRKRALRNMKSMDAAALQNFSLRESCFRIQKRGA
jgi:hypothetical protein